MKSNAEKSLELIIQVEKLNIEYKSLSDKIGNHLADCWNVKFEVNSLTATTIEPCLTEWLEKKFKTEYSNCPVTGREYEYQRPYWTAPQMTQKDCPHCYLALQVIKERKLLKQKRGRVRAQITKLAKVEILKGEQA